VTRIKVCGITRVEDALVAVRCGVDAIGLVFYKQSPRYVTTMQAKQLVDSIPPFVTIVGLFVNSEAKIIREVMACVSLDMLQFHGDESPEFCEQFSLPYLKAIRVKAGMDLLQYACDFHSAKGLLLDAHVDGIHGGTGIGFDWTLIPRELPLPVILSGGLTSVNVAAGIKQVQPYAVDVSSGVEASKGIKDAAKIAMFINKVKRIDV